MDIFNLSTDQSGAKYFFNLFESIGARRRADLSICLVFGQRSTLQYSMIST